MSLRTVRADLHVHTCLSPCGELEMTPVSIVQRCLDLGIEAAAVCDHNTARNIEGVRQAARGKPLKILSGMEVTTREEVHLLAVFDTPAQALELQNAVYGRLQEGENNDELFGMQVIANGEDEVEGFEHRLLIGGTSLSLDEAAGMIRDLGGLVIASHIDRQSFSLIGQLGIIPDDLPLDAVEVSRAGSIETMLQYPTVGAFPVMRSSDAHRLADLGGAWTDFYVNDITVAEFKRALKGEDGRSFSCGVRKNA